MQARHRERQEIKDLLDMLYVLAYKYYIIIDYVLQYNIQGMYYTTS